MEILNVSLLEFESLIPTNKFLIMKCGHAKIIMTSDAVSLFKHFSKINDQYEIFIPLTNVNSTVIDKKKIDCEFGNLLIINPGQKRGFSKNSRKNAFVAIFFEKKYMDRIIIQIAGEAKLFPNYIQTLRPEVHSLINKMIEEYRESRIGKELILKAFSEQLAVLLIRFYHHPVVSPKHDIKSSLSENQLRFREVIDFMNKHMEEKITVEQMAELSSMNRFRFIRSFQAAFGKSPYDYLTYLRIERAKKMLRNTMLTGNEIAKACGFFSQSRFSASFKQFTGMTPTKYRKHIVAEKKHLFIRNS